jgi:hypothetical protein
MGGWDSNPGLPAFLRGLRLRTGRPCRPPKAVYQSESASGVSKGAVAGVPAALSMMSATAASW